MDVNLRLLWNCQESKCKCLEKVQRGGKEVKNMEI